MLLKELRKKTNCTIQQAKNLLEASSNDLEKGSEVYFMPLSAKQSDNAKSNDKQTKSDNFGSKFASYFADVPLPKNANEELVIPNRPPSRAVSFE